MSNETVSKPRTRRSPAEGTSTAAERPAAEVSETTKKPVVPKEIDPNQIITVRNGFQGRLVYKSKRTGERWSWESFGAEQDMELSELKNARNSNKKYYRLSRYETVLQELFEHSGFRPVVQETRWRD